jgi:hypothetical protein
LLRRDAANLENIGQTRFSGQPVIADMVTFNDPASAALSMALDGRMTAARLTDRGKVWASIAA